MTIAQKRVEPPPPPRNGHHYKVMLYGGQADFAKKKITPSLKQVFGIEVVAHADWDHNMHKPLVPGIDFVIMLTDMMGTGDTIFVSDLCKRAGIPFVRGLRKWSSLYGAILQLGLRPVNDDAALIATETALTEVMAAHMKESSSLIMGRCKKCGKPANNKADKLCDQCALLELEKIVDAEVRAVKHFVQAEEQAQVQRRVASAAPPPLKVPKLRDRKEKEEMQMATKMTTTSDHETVLTLLRRLRRAMKAEGVAFVSLTDKGEMTIRDQQEE